MPNERTIRIRVRVCDGKRKEANKLKGQLAPHMDFIDVKDGLEFVICAVKEDHIDKVRPKLEAAGLEEIPAGDTSIPASAMQQALKDPQRQPRTPGERTSGENLRKKPYGFVSLPDQLEAKPPVWHDGTSSQGRLSGEVRCELETLTPLLVGWERQRIDDADSSWSMPYKPVVGSSLEALLQKAARQVYPDADDSDEQKQRKKQKKVEKDRADYIQRIRDDVIEVTLRGTRSAIKSKSVLCPLRAPWGKRPVLLPGDSLKGLLRHELGALLGAPMERVAERSYSYRPNSLYPNKPNPRLVPRLARVLNDRVETRELKPGVCVRVPVELELLPEKLKYDRKHQMNPPRYRFDPPNGGAAYRGGMGAGKMLNSKRRLHTRLDANPVQPATTVAVPDDVQAGYLNTLRHLTDLDHGHFSERHPDVPNTITGDAARGRILEAAVNDVFQPGDLIWVEWDTEKERIVSLGWHYYYRWAYADTVRLKGWTLERRGLFPLSEEKQLGGEEGDKHRPPRALSAVRRLFGYTGDNKGSKGIGKGDYEQLMGRVSVNTAVEVVEDGDTEEMRFLPPTFLRKLGMARPSAVEFYLKQPFHPTQRPWDRATLVTYGDAMGYEEPGELAGRKFYLDRWDAYDGEPWKDESEANRLNDRSTLALEASRPRRRFRFTVRFRDLDPDELAAILLALCPHQLRQEAGGRHPDGYCSKLGYARPLGWGTVRIEAKALYFLKGHNDPDSTPRLMRESNIREWFRRTFQPPPMLAEWLAVHRHRHPDAADYPRKNGQIYTFHSKLRAEHTRWRRYNREKKQ